MMFKRLPLNSFSKKGYGTRWKTTVPLFISFQHQTIIFIFLANNVRVFPLGRFVSSKNIPTCVPVTKISTYTAEPNFNLIRTSEMFQSTSQPFNFLSMLRRLHIIATFAYSNFVGLTSSTAERKLPGLQD